MPSILVPMITGQYSGFKNEVVMTTDKHRVIYNGTLNSPGVVQTRPGSTLVSDFGTGNILGLHDASFQDGTHTQLATFGTKVYNAQTGTEFSSQAFTSGKNMEFVNFLNLVFGVNGQDAMFTLTSGGTYSATTNVTNAPVANYIARYGSRIWANDTTNKRRVHRSLAVSAGAITWDTTTEFFDATCAGDLITGIHVARNTLMAFTNEDIEIRYFTRALLGTLRDVGTLSPRSVVTARGTTFWFHHDEVDGFRGIYGYDGAGADTAQQVSSPVQDVFDAMPESYIDNVVGWKEGSSIVWYLGGDITTLDYGTVNCVCLNIKTKGWSTWYLPYTILAAHVFLNNSTGVRTSYFGVSDGGVYSRLGRKDGSADIEAFLMPFPLSGPDTFAYYQFQDLNVKGSQFGSTRVIFRTDTEDKWNEEGLRESFKSKSIYEGKLGGSGSAIEMKLGLNDQVGQLIKSYKVGYQTSSTKQ